MIKEKWNGAIRDVNQLSELQYDDIERMASVYPFSQIIHLLLAKKSHNTQHPEFNKHLTLASAFHNDRTRLYHYIHDVGIEQKQPAKVSKSGKKTAKEKSLATSSGSVPALDLKENIIKVTSEEAGIKSDPQVKQKAVDDVSEHLKETEKKVIKKPVSKTRKKDVKAPLKAKSTGTAKKSKASKKDKPTRKKIQAKSKSVVKTKKSVSKSSAKTRPSTKTKEEKKSKTTTKPKAQTKKTSSTKAKAKKSKPSSQKTVKKETAKKKTNTSGSKAKAKSVKPQAKKIASADKAKQVTTKKTSSQAKAKRTRTVARSSTTKSDQNFSDFTTWLLSLRKREQTEDQSSSPITETGKKSELKPGKEEPILSEPLAELLIKQGHIKEAINMYEKLSLLNPAKSVYFARKIENLKKNSQ